ncbi:cobalamin B12-binding domain-containing protein [Salinarimonas chemoclinalis]|uniref:cobalamin B12-binding domain-containing protein n=1 Tax=Salinarimonas chemoclinalis TaxID=3241599 RepID=UPI00355912D3
MASLKEAIASSAAAPRSDARGDPRAVGQASRRSPRNEADRRDALSRTIEAEIIPRLMLVHTSDGCGGGDRQDPLPSHEEVVEFAGIVIAHDVEVATSYVSVLRARGATLETIFLHLLAPAANHLDALWREDKADFCDVTIALSRLQQVLRALSAPFEAEGDGGPEEKCILLVSSPGETHTFGVAIVEEFLRRAGWDSVCAPGTSLSELGRIVRTDWFDVVGLSLSCESLLAELASAIDVVRRRSRNKRIGVLVGGHYFNEHPESAALVGADLVAFDGLDAVRKAQRFVGGAARAR